ncbi:MAG TPA: translation elongation factor Ts [Candidatus Saccharimonadales bacterium]|nr:translation elongation factor Ts [Candidatus Saccharimonadales bacterium]
MPLNTTDVKKLRDQTGAGMMAAKEALEAAGGDMEKAIEHLRKAGQASAAKRVDRTASAGLIESYTHAGRIGVLVEVNCETDFVARTDDFKAFVHDIAMQVAATAPDYVRPEDVPAEVIAKEKDIYTAEAGSGKPKDVLDKIISGKLDKFYASTCLTKQPFIKAPDMTIEALQTDLIAKLGENVVIKRFARYELGV